MSRRAIFHESDLSRALRAGARDGGSMSAYSETRRALLTERLARVRQRIAELRRDPARWAALRAAEIEHDHLVRELAELGA